MNWDEIEGNWVEFKGRVKEQWGKLTDDDLAVIKGNRDRLAGRLQQLYGRAREMIESEIDRFCAACCGSESGGACSIPTQPSQSANKREPPKQSQQPVRAT